MDLDPSSGDEDEQDIMYFMFIIDLGQLFVK